jgi:hypothetical protein
MDGEDRVTWGTLACFQSFGPPEITNGKVIGLVPDNICFAKQYQFCQVIILIPTADGQ